jgi:hypothetical protein
LARIIARADGVVLIVSGRIKREILAVITWGREGSVNVHRSPQTVDDVIAVRPIAPVTNECLKSFTLGLRSSIAENIFKVVVVMTARADAARRGVVSTLCLEICPVAAVSLAAVGRAIIDAAASASLAAGAAARVRSVGAMDVWALPIPFCSVAVRFR